MFNPNDVIDAKYIVDGLCSSSGGMGTLLFVSPVSSTPTGRIVLKYCRDTDDEYLRRFRREIRLLTEFSGNSKVVEILDHNLSHDPPYFVMPYYPNGDLTKLLPSIATDYSSQEDVFLQMIDCVAELHSKGMFHRDIKPQNFLRDGDRIRVSDLGLSVERNSLTAFTTASQYWGTQGYLPPEFQAGGFKDADASGDVFMLGKSFYVILTGRDPLYLIGNGIPDALFHIIQKCCKIEKSERFQSLSELKQAMVAAYDILLRRVDGVSRAKQLLAAINARLDQQHQFDLNETNEFLDSLARLSTDEKNVLINEIPNSFYRILATDSLKSRVSEYLSLYRPMVEGINYSWNYAEVIASNMNVLFSSPSPNDADKAEALDLAIHAAVAMNRYAAMDTCRLMIMSIISDGLAILVREILQKYPGSFVTGIEPVSCAHNSIGAVIREMKAKEDAP